ncbi:hypothetical protein C7437_1011029 [Psychrobacillus insolitus]|uniref:Uncharacterized protein n=1 Tax=Psychrobacillus insolitus TaxID=1461 RepID=A0A2W7ML65_9BACI|nr:hypothetical protein [Psychrobacillus insolitus]PZX07907.1 hypothetical protein C7437_1011029 [Psychrobacillus insolitus]
MAKKHPVLEGIEAIFIGIPLMLISLAVIVLGLWFVWEILKFVITDFF